jgi:DNA repair and recombination protein RAD52
LEGWKLGNLANEILGFNGWSHSIVSQSVDFVDVQDGKYSVGISTVVRVTLKDGSYHEDCGYGSIDNCRQKAAAFEKSKKESVTDALKRTLKHFGNALGNCVYSKEYLKRIGKMGKLPSEHFDNTSLYRAPGFRKEPQAHPVKIAGNLNQIKTSVPLIPNPDKSTIAAAAERDEYGYSDDDEALLMAADLECISVDILQEPIPSSATDSITNHTIPNPVLNGSNHRERSASNPTNVNFIPPLPRHPIKPVAQLNKNFVQNRPPSRNSPLEPPKPFTRSHSSPK